MRDAQSALDQVIAFAGETITADDVSAVLGLIGRDPVLDAVEVVASEDAAAVFSLAGRFVEAGYDLRLVCRELSRVLRDMMVIGIDASRADDPEIAGDGERDRLVALAARFSREDLMRAFDVLSRAEFEIRNAAQPRHHFEMALLKWMHLRQLVPLTELLSGGASRVAPTTVTPTPVSSAAPPRRRPAPKPRSRPKRAAPPPPQADAPESSSPPPGLDASGPSTPPPEGDAPEASAPPMSTGGGTDDKAAILTEIKRAKKFFYGTVVAQAQRIDLDNDTLTFAFSPAQRTLASQLSQSRAWLETMASKVAGRPITVASAQTDGEADPAALAPSGDNGEADASAGALRAEAMDDQVVQAMLEVFPAEIRDVEKIDP